MVARLADAAGLRVVVAVAPMKVQVYGAKAGLDLGAGGAAAVLRQFARDQEMAVIDLSRRRLTPLAERFQLESWSGGVMTRTGTLPGTP